MVPEEEEIGDDIIMTKIDVKALLTCSSDTFVFHINNLRLSLGCQQKRVVISVKGKGRTTIGKGSLLRVSLRTTHPLCMSPKKANRLSERY